MFCIYFSSKLFCDPEIIMVAKQQSYEASFQFFLKSDCLEKGQGCSRSVDKTSKTLVNKREKRRLHRDRHRRDRKNKVYKHNFVNNINEEITF